ncbi:MAG: fused MFS/spermidine synthase [Verrucomicrobiota bacterium]
MKRYPHPMKSDKPAAMPQMESISPGSHEEIRQKWKGKQGITLHAMIFLSGFACLVYQILWMRQLGIVFGNTSHAAALTLAVFFAGLAIGSWFWGRRCPVLTNPLRTYGWLELGIATAGAAILAAPGLCQSLYPMLYGQDGTGFALMAFKLLWTFIMVFPAAFLMGGTIPVLGQHLIGLQKEFGATTARIYAVNTIGAACGAFATAFVLMWRLGFQLTCLVAVGISVAAAALAFLLSRHAIACDPDLDNGLASEPPKTSKKPSSKKRNKSAVPPPAPSLSHRQITCLAFVSGFNILALEVLWTRMFAQVHENSVYSFSTVLIIVLVCLALGATLASRLAGRSSSAPQTLVLLTAMGGAALSVSPFVFMSITGNLRMLPTDGSFAAYVASLFTTGFAAIGIPCFLLGAVFPFLMKGEEQFAKHPGKSIGMLASVNTLGAILGSLACGFLLLHWLGLWRSMQLASASYLMVAILVPAAKNNITRGAKIGALAMLVLIFTGLNPTRLPVTWTKDAKSETETVLEKWEASDCSVTVVKNTDDDLLIKINSSYTLGSTESYGPQIYQARIPLLVYPETDSVFFLGMGTGITAGEALNSDDFKNVKNVVTCELSPSVVAASKKYFSGGKDGPDLTNGLYRDPRSRVLIEDGRNHLMATRDSYAMINADLFLPYRSGAGSLYSLEHFQQVKKRLKPGGVFVQWLPLYQVTENEFGIISHTMLTVFPQVSLWRGNFQPGGEMVALIGHQDNSPLPACSLDAEEDKKMAVAGATYQDMLQLNIPINPQTILFFYCGNLTLAGDIFAKYPLNTDDKPIIEFGTPRSLHKTKDEGKPHFVETRFADMVDKIQSRTPPASDPLLASRSPSNRGLPLAGAAFHRANIAIAKEDEVQWKLQWQNFLDHWLKPAESGSGVPRE